MKQFILWLFILPILACGGALSASGTPTKDTHRVAALDRMLTETAAAKSSIQVTFTPAPSLTPKIVNSNPLETPTMSAYSAAFATEAAAENSDEPPTAVIEQATTVPAATISAPVGIDSASATALPSPINNTPLPAPTSGAEASVTATITLTATVLSSAVPITTPTPTLAPKSLTPTITPTLAGPTDTPLPPTSTPTIAPASTKKGVGITGGLPCPDVELLRASWYQTWDIYADPACRNKFVPRLSNKNHLAKLAEALENAKHSGWLMGFTEPNLSWQANMSPAEGAEAWHTVEEAARKAGIKLVSPSPNQFEPGQSEPYGHQWLWAMVDEYQKKYNNPPHFDAIAWNIYRNKPSKAQEYLTARHNEGLARGYNVPVWVLEYGGECWNSANSKNGNDQIMAETTAWLDSTDWVARYAWFANRLSGTNQEAEGWQSCTLINPNTNELTSLGQAYRLR